MESKIIIDKDKGKEDEVEILMEIERNEIEIIGIKEVEGNGKMERKEVNERKV